MNDPKALRFFEEVLQKTNQNRIQWEPTAAEGTYIAPIGGKFIVAVTQFEAEEPFVSRNELRSLAPFGIFQKERNELLLKDQEGRVLLQVSDSIEGVSSGDLRQLYASARRQALRVDENIDTVLGELGKL
jgi:hypothetical protein